MPRVQPAARFQVRDRKWDWVAYNSSMYKFVARHDGGETSGDSTCFGANTQWWTDKGMFTAGPDQNRRRRRQRFMENECDTNQNDKPQGCSNTQNSHPCRTVNCLVEPAYVASYAPYGRAAVTGSWQYTSNTAAPTTWATTTRVFELDISQFQLDEAGPERRRKPTRRPGFTRRL